MLVVRTVSVVPAPNALPGVAPRVLSSGRADLVHSAAGCVVPPRAE